MSYTNPNVTDFKNFFVRDFPYGIDATTSILDADVARAMLECSQMINPDLCPNGQEQYNLAYLYLSAHNLVTNIQASGQGVASQNDWLVNSKSVGNVSQASQIPQRILDNPQWAAYSKTQYGLKYLTMVMPYVNGAIYSVKGKTHA